MSTATIASIIDEVKLDVFSKTQTTDNANKRKEVSRTFICEPELLTISVDILTDCFSSSRHCHRLSSKIFNLPLNHVSVQFAVPTEEMLAYASLASLGDDVYFEPTTAYVHISSFYVLLISPLFRALETHIAKLTGKEAGLFLPSGTASNQIALRTHLKQPPYSVLCDHRSHIDK